MSDPRQTKGTPFGRWRERRQAKRQQTLERAYVNSAQASSPALERIEQRTSRARDHAAPAWFWGGFGGGGGFDGGGGGGGCDGGGGGGGGC